MRKGYWSASAAKRRPTAGANLNPWPLHADAMTSAREWADIGKIVVTFAVAELPASWIEAIPEGGRLVAPVGPRESDQKLVLVRRDKGKIVRTEHGAVRYVQNRSSR